MRSRERYRDRTEAGLVLADAVAEALRESTPCVVLALPRGGVPVAIPIVQRFGGTLGLMIVRKLGVPGRPELAMGALARIGDRTELVRNEAVIADARVDDATFERVRREEGSRLSARAARYGEPPVEASGRTVILVDDGLATGMTALASVSAARSLDPERVVLAVPVGSPQAVRALSRAADLVVCPLAPRGFAAVSGWYDDFDQVSDAEVAAALAPFRP